MASTASSVAIAMEIIAALDLFYNTRLNAAVAIFQIFASQMLGYGMAGIRTSRAWTNGHSAHSFESRSAHIAPLSDIVSIGKYVPPLMPHAFLSAFYPTYISVVSLLQSLHFGGTLNHKRRFVGL